MSVNGENLICTACNKPLGFQTEECQLLRCSCNVVWGRNAEGRLMELDYPRQDFPSSLNPEEQGELKGRKFTCIGKVTLRLDDVIEYYYTVLYADGELQLILDSNGSYYLMTPLSYEINSLTGKLDHSGTHDTFDVEGCGGVRIVNHDECFIIDLEGECYSPLVHISEKYFLRSVVDEAYYEVWRHKGSLRLFKIDSLTRDSLLNEAGYPLLPVWEEKLFTCSVCSNQVTVPYFPAVQTAFCAACAVSYFYAKDNQWRRTHYRNYSVNFDNSVLSLGTQLELGKEIYEVIGVLLKSDKQDNEWMEYTLYKPVDKSFAFLNESAGNYILLKVAERFPSLYGASPDWFDFDDERYELHLMYYPKVDWGQGVFVGNFILSNHTVAAYDYAAPPKLMSLERRGNKNNFWFSGEHVQRKDLRKQLDKQGLVLADKFEVGLVETGSAYKSIDVVRVVLMVLIVLLSAHWLVNSTNHAKQILDTSYGFPVDSQKMSVVTSKFALDRFRSNLEIELGVPVNNDWVAVDYTLVSALTGEEYEGSADVEYYHGVDGGESWSEGSQRKSYYFSGIPKGEYYLSLALSKSASGPLDNVSFINLKITSGVGIGYNLWLPILLVLIWPAYIINKNYTVNNER